MTDFNKRVTEWCEPMPDPDSGPGPYSPEKFWRYNFGGDPATRWMPRYDFTTDHNACALAIALADILRELSAGYDHDVTIEGI